MGGGGYVNGAGKEMPCGFRGGGVDFSDLTRNQKRGGRRFLTEGPWAERKPSQFSGTGGFFRAPRGEGQSRVRAFLRTGTYCKWRVSLGVSPPPPKGLEAFGGGLCITFRKQKVRTSETFFFFFRGEKTGNNNTKQKTPP